MSSARVWFITGTSSGFGLEMARCALAHGDRVVATLRKPEVLKEFAFKYTPQQLLILRLDVSKHEEIKAAFAKAKEVFGRIDVVFNNARYAVAGEAEAIPSEAARALFDVNFWGAAHVSQEAVRFFRDENSPRGGRLILNRAAPSLTAVPTMAFHCAANHALGGFTETLSKELDPAWNVKISAILHGGFVTDVVQRLQTAPQNPAYADPTNPASLTRNYSAASLDKEGPRKGQWSDPVKGAQKVYELSQLSDPPLRLVLGKDANNAIGEYLTQLKREVEQYASWSDDLAFETN